MIQRRQSDAAGAFKEFLLQDKEALLCLAAETNAVDAIRVAQEFGADIDVSNEGGYAPAHCAARNGHTAALRRLKELGADIDAQNTRGYTPVHLAAARNKAES